MHFSTTFTRAKWIESELDLNWIYFERGQEVGRLADLNWIASAISRVNARRIRTISRSGLV